ncbi:hypothetical protein SK803_46160 [Lentzea sp. BCCO 10_0856]|uniref:Uncharacterized protein n=1 Tax=Lentzea miocenica TaxID=3095431 RepID=A0ABU4THF3_9PSEU|nr:hypothetical protein [Lentzea sp. BCCO 10_0856]MDX8037626.1 hypothetical protein [Lentzea sp. BCCO 10_0856]
MAGVVSYVFVRDLNISFRWTQPNTFQEVIRGDFNVSREFPVIARDELDKTWVDNTDIYRAVNRYLERNYPDWRLANDPVSPPSDSHAQPPPPRVYLPRQAVRRGERSTDFVRA